MLLVRLFVVFISLIFFVQTVPANDQKIEKDYALGKITYIEKVTYLGYRVFAPEKLPQQYQTKSASPIKCATGIVAELKNSMNDLSPDDQQLFKALLQRPVYPKYYLSPSGKFRLHYTESSSNAVSSTDSDQSGISDYIEEAAEIFDYCYQFEIDTLDYEPPPSDNSIDGPEIDIYFTNIYDAYAYTYFEEEIPNTPYEDWTSYLVIDNDFQGNFFTKGIDALKVTFAHEFFHMIQGAYFIGFVNSDFKDRFFYEMSSTWMEEMVYSEINDYYQYLPSFFSNTRYPLSYWNNNFEYGSSIFLIFVQQNYGPEIIKRSWELLKNSYDNSNYNSIKALKAAFEEEGFTFEDAFSNFGVWNYFTGYRSNIMKFYEEAHAYPMFAVNDTIRFNSEVSVSDTIYAITTNYHILNPEISGNIILRQAHDDPNNWRSAIIIDKVDPDISSEIHSQSIVNLDHVNSFDNLILVSANVEIPDVLSNQLSNYSKSISQFNFSRESLTGEEMLFPNPYISELHQILKIKVNLPSSTELDCSILSETGRLVYQYSLGEVQAGEALIQIPWDGKENTEREVSSGVYVCLLSGDGINIPFKFVYVRK